MSEKESGVGDRDVYISDIDVNGEWGPAKNLGPRSIPSTAKTGCLCTQMG